MLLMGRIQAVASNLTDACPAVRILGAKLVHTGTVASN